MRRIVVTVVIAALAGTLVALIASGELAQAGPAAAPVMEQNLDGNGFIRVHEQGTATVHVPNVESDPLLTRDVDGPLNPFQREVQLGPEPDNCKDIAVDEQQRLVIEYVSALLVAGRQEGSRVDVHTTANGVPADHVVPVTEVGNPPASAEAVFFNAGEDVRIYADPGSTVQICAFNLVEGFFVGGGEVTISGHAVGPPTPRRR